MNASQGEFVDPTQLQVVLTNLWNADRPDPNQITLQDVQSAGGVDQALADYYAQAVVAASNDSGVSEDNIRSMIGLHLIENNVRRPVKREAEMTAGLPNQVIDDLLSSRLLKSELQQGENWLELASERLIGPIQDDNARWRQAQQAQRAQPASEPLFYPSPVLKNFTVDRPGWLLRIHPEHPNYARIGEDFQKASPLTNPRTNDIIITTWGQSDVASDRDSEGFLKQAMRDDPVLVLQRGFIGLARLTDKSLVKGNLVNRLFSTGRSQLSLEPYFRFTPPIPESEGNKYLSELSEGNKYLSELNENGTPLPSFSPLSIESLQAMIDAAYQRALARLEPGLPTKTLIPTNAETVTVTAGDSRASTPAPLPQAWIVVAKPKQYPWEDNFGTLAKDGKPVEVTWDHARGSLAQVYIKRSRPGDLVLTYLSSAKKRAIIGLAEVVAIPVERDGWWSVRIALRQRFSKDITLNELKKSLPGLEKVRVGRASYSRVAPDLWPKLRSLIIARNSALDARLPSALAGADQPTLTLALSPSDFPNQLLPDAPFSGKLLVSNTGSVELAGGPDAPPVSITAEWSPASADEEEETRTSYTITYPLAASLPAGETREWSPLRFDFPRPPAKYELSLVVTDPERGLAEVAPPINVEVLDPSAPVPQDELRRDIDSLRRELRESVDAGAPAVAAIDRTLAQARGALAEQDVAAADRLLEQARTAWATWQHERNPRNELELKLRALTAEADQNLPETLAAPFQTQVEDLRQRSDAMAPLVEVESRLANLQALGKALDEENRRLESELAGFSPAEAQTTREILLAGLAVVAGQPYQKDVFEQVAADLDQKLVAVRQKDEQYRLTLKLPDVPPTATAGELLTVNLALFNAGQSAWTGGTQVVTSRYSGSGKTPHIFKTTLPAGGIAQGSDFTIPLKFTLKEKPTRLSMLWKVEIPEHGLEAQTERITIQIQPKAAAGAGVVQPPGVAPATETRPIVTQPVTSPGDQTAAFQLSAFYNMTGFAPPPPPPADEKLTIEINREYIELRFIENGRESKFRSPTTRLSKDNRLDNPFDYQPRQYGQMLFNALFFDQVYRKDGIESTLVGYRRARPTERRREVELSINTDRDFGYFAWELLTDDRNVPLSTFEVSPFYRSYGPPASAAELQSWHIDQGPLKILFTICNPLDLQPLDPEKARQHALQINEYPNKDVRRLVRQLPDLDSTLQVKLIKEAMQKLEARPGKGNALVEYRILGEPGGAFPPPVTFSVLQQTVNEWEPHVLHINAHGIIKPKDGRFNLVMENNERRFDLVDPLQFDARFDQRHALRLVVLAACNSGDANLLYKSQADLASQLLKINIPAVIAMSERIDELAAQMLTRRFYDDLARLGRIEMALAAARSFIYSEMPSKKAWGVPLLWMRPGMVELLDPDPTAIADHPRISNEEIVKDLKNYQQLTGKPLDIEERIKQAIDQVFSSLGVAAPAAALSGFSGSLAAHMSGKPKELVPLAEKPRPRSLAMLIQKPVELRAAELQTYVQDHAGLKLPPETYGHITASLNAGKHLILIGPHGTAKTTLARAICEFASTLRLAQGYKLSTATADWTTFDTIGGYMPDQDQNLQFRPGLFLEAIRQGAWLIIDEINRAEIDKAIGPLFTVLSGQQVNLPYKIGDAPVNILPANELRQADFAQNPAWWVPSAAHDDGYDYVIHPNWRIIGTMNVYDKSSLFQLSFAFMRRFAFIDVDLPGDADYRLLISRWLGESVQTQVNKIAPLAPAVDEHPALVKLKELLERLLWHERNPLDQTAAKNPLMSRRAIGPAITKDMIYYIGNRCQDYKNLPDPKPALETQLLEYLGEAFAIYIVPQLDGLDHQGIKDVHLHIEKSLFQAVEYRKVILTRIEMLYPHIPKWSDNSGGEQQ